MSEDDVRICKLAFEIMIKAGIMEKVDRDYYLFRMEKEKRCRV